jgi:hypothetical protein
MLGIVYRTLFVMIDAEARRTMLFLVFDCMVCLNYWDRAHAVIFTDF